MLEIICRPVSAFAQNARILYSSYSQEAILIDPGGEAEVLLSLLKEKGLKPAEIWLTHSHIDHCGAVLAIKKKFPALVLRAHREEAFMRAHVADLARMYGIPASEADNCPEPEHYLVGGEKIEFGALEFLVKFTPGHSPGHVVFYCSAEKLCLSGDLVFQDSVGRTDLPGGDEKTLMASIKREILSLPDETRLLTGHGPDTTVGRERSHNPFFARI